MNYEVTIGLETHPPYGTADKRPIEVRVGKEMI